PKHVGRADIARADFTDIALAGEPRQKEPERDRPEQIAERQGKEHLAGHRGGGSKPERLRNALHPPRDFAGRGTSVAGGGVLFSDCPSSPPTPQTHEPVRDQTLARASPVP